MTQEENKVEEQKECTCCHETDDTPHVCGGGCHQETNATLTEELTNEVTRLTDEKQALVDKVKLAQAELINYRKRKDEETQSLLKYANQDLILEIIQLVDNFERALNQDETKISEETSKFLSGFKMMYQSLKETLTRFGVEEISRVGQVFNPSEEQALLVESRDDLDDEVVIDVLLKGYKLKDRVIRPASVKINQK